MAFQTTTTKRPDRKSHVWRFVSKRGLWKCILCGGLSRKPQDVENGETMPDSFEALTDEERQMCPFKGARI